MVSLLYTPEQDVPDSHGSYPLHLFGDISNDDNYARGGGGSVDFLATKNPDVLFKKNKSGNTPLHNLASVPCKPGTTFFNDFVSVMKPEALYTKNNSGLLPVHVASVFHSVPFVNAMITICPDTLYAMTPTSKTIFSFLDICHDHEKLELITCILSGDFEVNSLLWNFIPHKLPGLESHLHSFKDESITKALKYVTPHGRHIFYRNLYALHSFTIHMNIEQDILKRITLLSLRH
jgi:hypothetical protein